jgi:hypothetical protein
MQPSGSTSNRYSRSRDYVSGSTSATAALPLATSRVTFRGSGQVPTYRVSLGRPSASDPHAYFTPRESAHAYRAYDRVPAARTRDTATISATRDSAERAASLGKDWVNETVEYSRQQHVESSSSAAARRSYLAGAHQPRTYGRQYYPQQREYPLDYAASAANGVAPRYSYGISTSDPAAAPVDPAHASYYRAPPPPPMHSHDPHAGARQHSRGSQGVYPHHQQQQQQPPYYPAYPHEHAFAEHHSAYAQRGPLDVNSPPGASLSSSSSPTAATSSPRNNNNNNNRPQQSADPLRQQIYRLVTQALGLQDQGLFDEARQIISVIEQLQRQAEADYESKSTTGTAGPSLSSTMSSTSSKGPEANDLTPLAMQPPVVSAAGSEQMKKKPRSQKPRKASAVLDQVHAERMIEALSVQPAPVPTSKPTENDVQVNSGQVTASAEEEEEDDEDEMDAELQDGENMFSDDEDPKEDQVVDAAPVVSSLADEVARRKEQIRKARLARQASSEQAQAADSSSGQPLSYAAAASKVDAVKGLPSPLVHAPPSSQNGVVHEERKDSGFDDQKRGKKENCDESGGRDRARSLIRSKETETDEGEYGVPLILAPPEEAEIFRTLVSRSRFREQQVKQAKSGSASPSADSSSASEGAAAAATKPNPAAERDADQGRLHEEGSASRTLVGTMA